MRVLCACEESQAVTVELRRGGAHCLLLRFVAYIGQASRMAHSS